MQSNLQHTFEFLEQIPFLQKEVQSLKSELTAINDQLVANQSHLANKWVYLSEAAKQVGMTTPALRSRIKRYQYPENIVWKQKSPKSTIFINLVELGEYL